MSEWTVAKFVLLLKWCAAKKQGRSCWRSGQGPTTLPSMRWFQWNGRWNFAYPLIMCIIFPWEEANISMSNEQELGEEEKQDWNAKAAEAMEAYKKALEEYNKSVAAEKAPRWKLFKSYCIWNSGSWGCAISLMASFWGSFCHQPFCYFNLIDSMEC